MARFSLKVAKWSRDDVQRLYVYALMSHRAPQDFKVRALELVHIAYSQYINDTNLLLDVIVRESHENLQ